MGATCEYGQRKEGVGLLVLEQLMLINANAETGDSDGIYKSPVEVEGPSHKVVR